MQKTLNVWGVACNVHHGNEVLAVVGPKREKEDRA